MNDLLKDGEVKLRVQEDDRGETHVEGLSEEALASLEGLQTLLLAVERRRHVSSRGACVRVAWERDEEG